MSNEQDITDQELSARYQRELPQSPAQLDQRILALAEQRAPVPAPASRSWNWSPAWSAIAVVCLVALFLPSLLQSPPAPVLAPADLREGMEAAQMADSSLRGQRDEAATAAAPRVEGGLNKSMARPLHKISMASGESLAAGSDSLPAATAARAAPQLSEPAVAPMRTEADLAAVKLSEKQWLQRIDKLLEQEQVRSAQQVYQQFRLAYPEATVEAELLKRLQLKP